MQRQVQPALLNRTTANQGYIHLLQAEALGDEWRDGKYDVSLEVPSASSNNDGPALAQHGDLG